MSITRPPCDQPDAYEPFEFTRVRYTCDSTPFVRKSVHATYTPPEPSGTSSGMYCTPASPVTDMPASGQPLARSPFTS